MCSITRMDVKAQLISISHLLRFIIVAFVDSRCHDKNIEEIPDFRTVEYTVHR